MKGKLSPCVWLCLPVQLGVLACNIGKAMMRHMKIAKPEKGLHQNDGTEMSNERRQTGRGKGRVMGAFMLQGKQKRPCDAKGDEHDLPCPKPHSNPDGKHRNQCDMSDKVRQTFPV